MITLANIEELRPGTNLCRIRIPLFEGAGNIDQVDIWATMMLPPGIHDGYKEGDIVFISFSDNSLNKPVVLGQLYRGSVNEYLGAEKDKFDRAGTFSCDNLHVYDEVKIPLSTAFVAPDKQIQDAGDYGTISKLIDKIRSLEASYATLSETVDTLKSEIANLQERCTALENEENKGF